MGKFYCEKCEKSTETVVKTVREEYPVKDEVIEIDANIRHCLDCNEEIWDDELDGENIRRAYNEYKRRKGLLLPEEIKAIRDKYGLSQSSFAKLLGFGEKTVTRYENGAIQDKGQDNLIRLVNDARVFEKLWNFNSKEIGYKENYKIEKTLHQIKKTESGVVVLSIPYQTANQYTYKSIDR